MIHARPLSTMGLLCALLLAMGCSHVVTYSTPYYKDGPRQARQPDGTVKAGSGVWVVGVDGSYYHVWTDEGIDAFVNKAAVRPMLDWMMQKRAEEQAAAKSRDGDGSSGSSAQPLYRPPPEKSEEKPRWRLFGEEPKPKPQPEPEPAPQPEPVEDSPSEP